MPVCVSNHAKHKKNDISLVATALYLLVHGVLILPLK